MALLRLQGWRSMTRAATRIEAEWAVRMVWPQCRVAGQVERSAGQGVPFDGQALACLGERRVAGAGLHPAQVLFDHAGECAAAGLLITVHQPQRGGNDDFVGLLVLRCGHASLLGVGWLARRRWRAVGGIPFQLLERVLFYLVRINLSFLVMRRR